MVVLLY